MTKEEIEAKVLVLEKTDRSMQKDLSDLQGAIRRLSSELNSVANMLATLNEKVSNMTGDIGKLKAATQETVKKYDASLTRYE